MSDTTPAGVYQCIAHVSAELAREGVAKTRQNMQQNYRFRGIDDVLNALAPLLAKHGLVILPRVLTRTQTERPSRSGGLMFFVVVEMDFDIICAADGSRHTVRMFGEAMDSADKATNKAMSAAYKYAAVQAFCIPLEGADDADADTPEPVAAAMPHRPVKPAPVLKAAPPSYATIEPVDQPIDNRLDAPPLPIGAVFIERVDHTPTKNPKVTKHLITTSTGETFSTIKDKYAKLATKCQTEGIPVRIIGNETQWGLDVDSLEIATAAAAPDDDIPF